MSDLLVWRKKIQEFYAKKSLYIDKGLQFLLGLVTFLLINQNIGVVKSIASPVVSIGLAVICTFLPPIVIVLAAAALVLVHLFMISMGVMGVTALVFMLMFIFYCRFSPNRAIILLITPLAFWLHIPYVIPVACGLALTPVAAVPVSFGTIAYYMLSYVKDSAAALSSAEGVTGQITLFVKAVFMNKELWITVMAFIICIFVVYAVRRRAIDHAWKIAIAAGAIANIIVIAVGNIVMDINVSYVGLILGNLAAIALGFVLEFFLFSVDYTRTEQLQYEDDEYYYFVKAVPKVSIAAPEKTVKKINERREDDESEEIRRKVPKKSAARRPVKRKAAASTEQVLLERSLSKEFGVYGDDD